MNALPTGVNSPVTGCITITSKFGKLLKLEDFKGKFPIDPNGGSIGPFTTTATSNCSNGAYYLAKCTAGSSYKYVVSAKVENPKTTGNTKLYNSSSYVAGTGTIDCPAVILEPDNASGTTVLYSAFVK
jgi:hypothetical protein